MKLRMFLSALFKLRNIGVLLAGAGISYLGDAAIGSLLAAWNTAAFSKLTTLNLIEILATTVIYLVFVLQTLLSKQFHKEFNHKEKIRAIQDLNYACLRLANEAKKHTNIAYLQKLRKVMEDKNDIVNSFFRGKHNYIKEKIVEQTLNLVVAYIKLLTNFCIRSKELGEMDVSDIINRINTNSRKLNFITDSYMAEDVKNLVEMDEKIITRLKEEKIDIERISAKLDYMESTVGVFKQQILTNIESQETLEKIETVVNEATALDNVLEERRRNKIRF